MGDGLLQNAYAFDELSEKIFSSTVTRGLNAASTQCLLSRLVLPGPLRVQ